MLPRDGLVLSVPASLPTPPPLRFERQATDRQLILRQGARTLFLSRKDTDGCCRYLHLHRLTGHRSPLPPLRASQLRTCTDWTHQYARWLEETAYGPLHHGRWRLTRRAAFTPGIWTTDLVRDWPHTTLELLCGGGWHGILPLRPLSSIDAPRVKAYRKHAREGTLAPVLLWWVSFLDGWVILDGHGRATAALAEGEEPVCVELVQLPHEHEWRREAERPPKLRRSGWRPRAHVTTGNTRSWIRATPTRWPTSHTTRPPPPYSKPPRLTTRQHGSAHHTPNRRHVSSSAGPGDGTASSSRSAMRTTVLVAAINEWLQSARVPRARSPGPALPSECYEEQDQRSRPTGHPGWPETRPR